VRWRGYRLFAARESAGHHAELWVWELYRCRGGGEQANWLESLTRGNARDEAGAKQAAELALRTHLSKQDADSALPLPESLASLLEDGMDTPSVSCEHTLQRGDKVRLYSFEGDWQVGEMFDSPDWGRMVRVLAVGQGQPDYYEDVRCAAVKAVYVRGSGWMYRAVYSDPTGTHRLDTIILFRRPRADLPLPEAVQSQQSQQDFEHEHATVEHKLERGIKLRFHGIRGVWRYIGAAPMVRTGQAGPHILARRTNERGGILPEVVCPLRFVSAAWVAGKWVRACCNYLTTDGHVTLLPNLSLDDTGKADLPMPEA
jgi:hypothetical protein